VEDLDLHIKDRFMTEGSKREKGEWIEPLDAHLAAKEEKSSCVMLETASLDRMSFSASSLIFWIPSFFQDVNTGSYVFIGSTHCHCQRIHRTRGTRPWLLRLGSHHRTAIMDRSLEGRKGHLVRVGVGNE
jgi:hypothetical protein